MSELMREKIEEHMKYYAPLQDIDSGMLTEKSNAVFQVSICSMALRSLDLEAEAKLAWREKDTKEARLEIVDAESEAVIYFAQLLVDNEKEKSEGEMVGRFYNLRQALDCLRRAKVGAPALSPEAKEDEL